jgi:hypothetical protein
MLAGMWIPTLEMNHTLGFDQADEMRGTGKITQEGSRELKVLSAMK